MTHNPVLVIVTLLTACLVANRVPAQNPADSTCLQALGSTDDALREETIESLVLSGPSSLYTLMHGLRHGNGRVRENAAIALGLLGPDSFAALDALSHVLQAKENADVRQAAARALTSIGEPGIRRVMAELNHQDPKVRNACIGALQSIGVMAKPAVPELIRALGNRDSTVRRGAIQTLGSIGRGAESAIPALAQIIRDNIDPLDQWMAAGSLARIGPASIGPLTRLIATTQLRSRAAAAVDLAGTGEQGERVLSRMVPNYGGSAGWMAQ